MPFHRLVAPTYYPLVPWPPPGYGWINNDPAVPANQAPADGAKVGGTYPGTYFIDFGEDAYSQSGNRTHQALAENTDHLDDVLNNSIPKVTYKEGTTLILPVGSMTITGEVFVGEAGTPDPAAAGRLFSVVDPNTNNELVSSNGTRIAVTSVDDGGGGGVIGNGFQTDPRIFFTPAIPQFTDYRIVYGARSSYKEISSGAPAVLSGLIKESIRAAHLVPGEVVRVLMETLRRQAGPGAVEALQCTLIETPTAPNPLATGHNLITIDVDTAGDYANGGELRVSFSGGSQLLRVKESVLLGKPSHWGSDGTIRFSDDNIDTMSTPYTVPLSSSTVADGDAYLRLFEEDPTGIAVSSIPSIFKAINARASVTVGDGTRSFGDFNGADAIEQALNAFAALGPGITTFHIFVKEGIYSTFHAAAFPGGDVIIEGVGPTSYCRLDGNITLNGPLTLRNLTLRNLSLASATITLPSLLIVESCTLIGLGFELEPTSLAGAGHRNIYHIVDSTFTGSYDPVVKVTLQSSNMQARGLIMERCQVNMAGEFPVLALASAAAASSTFEGVLFQDCELKLAGTGTTGGNLDANVGVVELYPTISTPIVQDMTFKECRVRANWQGSGANSILLYLRTFDGLNSIRLDHLVIEGGEWVVPGQDTEISPVYIGGQTTSNLLFRPGKVTIKDVRWGFESGGAYVSAAPYGVGTTETSGTFSSAFSISADTIEIHNLEHISSLLQSGNVPELHLVQAETYEVSGIKLQNFVADPSVAVYPNIRMVIEGFPTDGSKGSIKGLVIDGGTPTPNRIAEWAALFVLPYGRLLMRDCSFTNIGTGGTANAIYIYPYLATNSHHGLDIGDSYFQYIPGSGIYTLFNNANVSLNGLSIRGCEIRDCGLQGISLGTALGPSLHSVLIEGCYIRDCTGAGIWYYPDTFSDGVGAPVIQNNKVVNNNGGWLNTQILIGNLAGTDGGTMYGTILGNNLGGGYPGNPNSAMDTGYISFAGATTPRMVLGSETGYDTQTTLIRFIGSVNFGGTGHALHSNNNVMFRNYAKLYYGVAPP